jgi:hypothetical protein
VDGTKRSAWALEAQRFSTFQPKEEGIEDDDEDE